MNFKRRYHEDLDFDKVAFDGFAQEHGIIEQPLNQNVFWAAFVVAIIIFTVTLFRIGYLGIWLGDFYAKRAEANINRPINLPAPRGIIVDRFGKVIAQNAASFSLVLHLEKNFKKSSDLSVLLESIGNIVKQSPDSLAQEVKKTDLEKGDSVVLARNLSLDEVIALRALNNSSLEIQNDYARDYTDGPIFAHVVGYTGYSNLDNEIVGQVGLEAEYETYLHGRDGQRVLSKDAKGNILENRLVSQSLPGYTLKTTLDADFQRYVYHRMQVGLDKVGSHAGVALAIDPSTGEVLSMVSFPSFNNNVFSSPDLSNERQKLLDSSYRPLFNRAISGVYNPGSTIKPLVALAAFREKLVDEKTTVFSAGFIEIPNPYFPDKPSRFLDWKPNGLVDVHSALAKSSNIYFYALGGGLGDIKGLGIDKLNQYWKFFQLGKKTGIDLTSEQDGSLPNPQSKEDRTGQIWRIGDTYNVSIGQGDLLITPMQLMDFIGSIANQGVMMKPHIMKDVEDENKSVIVSNQSEKIMDYSSWKSELWEVYQGMQDAVGKPYGTANMLSTLPISAAAKTGSAQILNNTKTNAFVVGYAPAENPKIAFLILVEDSKEGSLNAVPIAYDVLKWYSENRLASTTQAVQN